MNAFLINTRGRRPFNYALILVPGEVEPGKPASFKCKTLNDPLVHITRLAAVEILIANQSDEKQLQEMSEKGDVNGLFAWLEAGEKAEQDAAAEAEPAPAEPAPTPGGAVPAPEPEPEEEPPPEPKHKEHKEAAVHASTKHAQHSHTEEKAKPAAKRKGGR